MSGTLSETAIAVIKWCWTNGNNLFWHLVAEGEKIQIQKEKEQSRMQERFNRLERRFNSMNRNDLRQEVDKLREKRADNPEYEPSFEERVMWKVAKERLK